METVVTGGTVEEHHVASNPFGLEHTQEKIATELAVELCCSHEGVDTIRTDIESQVARRRGGHRVKILVRVSCQDCPSGFSRGTLKDHCHTFVL